MPIGPACPSFARKISTKAATTISSTSRVEGRIDAIGGRRNGASFALPPGTK